MPRPKRKEPKKEPGAKKTIVRPRKLVIPEPQNTILNYFKTVPKGSSQENTRPLYKRPRVIESDDDDIIFVKEVKDEAYKITPKTRVIKSRTCKIKREKKAKIVERCSSPDLFDLESNNNDVECESTKSSLKDIDLLSLKGNDDNVRKTTNDNNSSESLFSDENSNSDDGIGDFYATLKHECKQREVSVTCERTPKSPTNKRRSPRQHPSTLAAATQTSPQKEPTKSLNCLKVEKQNPAKGSTVNQPVVISDDSDDEEPPVKSSSALPPPKIVALSSKLAAPAQKSQAVKKEVKSPAKVLTANFTQKPSQFRMPYYLENFEHVLRTVRKEPDDARLFDDTDENIIQDYNELTVEAKMIFVKIFQRKPKWHRLDQLKYPDIAQDLEEFFQELVSLQFLNSEKDLLDMNTALELMPLPDLKTLAKPLCGTSAGTKCQLIKALAIHSTCRGANSYFDSSSKSNETVVLERAKALLGKCYKITENSRGLFLRVFLLFNLPATLDQDDGANRATNNQILQLLQIKKGEVSFPACRIKREAKIFRERSDLVRFSCAISLEQDMINAMTKGNTELATEILDRAKAEFVEILSDLELAVYEKALPDFLRRFTAGAVYARILTQGVDLLEKQRKYEKAVTLLYETLLDQFIYCQDYRGFWFDRLALDHHVHLRKPDDALERIAQGLADDLVSASHKLSLSDRATTICTPKNRSNLATRLKKIKLMICSKPKEITIKGNLISKSIPGRQYVFVSSQSPASQHDDVTIIPVESVAIEHYKTSGFTDARHCENKMMKSLFGLLFWDILYYSDIPDVFRTQQHSQPMDLDTADFYRNRRKAIDDRLAFIRTESVNVLSTEIADCWKAHKEESCLVDWGLFRLDELTFLLDCIGGRRLGDICERLAKDFKHNRAGFPDLIVWNRHTKKWKVSEVKGPNDKLSNKQRLWLQFLTEIGADAEVCYVVPVGAKKVRKRSSK